MEKQYCIHCGSEVTSDICDHCGRKADRKDYSIIDYLYNHIRDDLKSQMEDKVIDIIKNYILSHLYGTVMVVSLVGVAVTAAVKPMPNANAIVTEPPVVEYVTDPDFEAQILEAMNVVAFVPERKEVVIFGEDPDQVNIEVYGSDPLNPDYEYMDIVMGIYQHRYVFDATKFEKQISKDLEEQGYRVAELVLSMGYGNQQDKQYEMTTDLTVLYDTVAVYDNGLWKIAYLQKIQEIRN